MSFPSSRESIASVIATMIIFLNKIILKKNKIVENTNGKMGSHFHRKDIVNIRAFVS